MHPREAQGLMLTTGTAIASVAFSLAQSVRANRQARLDREATDGAVRSWQDLVDDLENENAALREQNGALRSAQAGHRREIEMLRAEVATLQMRAAAR